jgi:hypothetical protein
VKALPDIVDVGGGALDHHSGGNVVGLSPSTLDPGENLDLVDGLGSSDA